MTSTDEQGPAVRPRLEARGLIEAVENFTRHLVELGHTPLTVSGYEAGARHFGDWLHRSGISPDRIDDNAVEQFAHHECCCPGIRRCSVLSAHYVARVRRFVVFLAEAGIIKLPSSSRPPVNIRIVAFQTWLREHRGLSEPTIDRNGRMVARLLLALGDDPASYDAALVRRVILDEVGKSSVPYVKTMTTALRGYLNFLATRGECRPGPGRAIPTVPQWRLSALPRYLPAEDVERLIAACDPDTPCRIRDRAILLLLARLGLRAGDILDMKLEDIDWAVGTLRVSGKGRREIRLPLPQDAGDALLDYLERGRPRVPSGHVFLRSAAPFRPFAASCAISDVVRLALARAGITNAPTRGTNLLRHSAATAMLRAGATLDVVGTVLRHRSTDTTAHYAKVDLTMLQRVVQSWPGSVSC